jgi:hypothetical protein
VYIASNRLHTDWKSFGNDNVLEQGKEFRRLDIRIETFEKVQQPRSFCRDREPWSLSSNRPMKLWALARASKPDCDILKLRIFSSVITGVYTYFAGGCDYRARSDSSRRRSSKPYHISSTGPRLGMRHETPRLFRASSGAFNPMGSHTRR